MNHSKYDPLEDYIPEIGEGPGNRPPEFYKAMDEYFAEGKDTSSGRNPNTIDSRELIPFDYKQMNAEQLQALKVNLWHTITKQQTGVVAMHHEYNQVCIALKDLQALEREQQREGQVDHANP